MRITDIEPKGQNTGRFTIYADNQYLTIVNEEIIKIHNLYIDKEIDGEEIERISHSAALRKARERALHLLSDKAYTRKELFDKLIKTNEEDISNEVLDLLAEHGLVDDIAYAKQFAYEFSKYKKCGEQKILFELKRRGVSLFDIEDALDDFEFNSIDEINELIEKRFKNKIFQENGLRKVSDALYRKGYSFSDIKSAIEPYKNQLKEMDENV